METLTLALLGAFVALMNAITAYMTYKTRVDMHTVKEQTDGIKDALVASTERSAMAEGTAIGLKQGREEER